MSDENTNLSTEITSANDECSDECNDECIINDIKTKGRERKFLFPFLAFVCAVSFIISSYLLISHRLEVNKANEEFEKMRQIKKSFEMEEDRTKREEEIAKEKRAQEKEAYLKKMEDRSINKEWFQMMDERNPDFSCWINQKDSKIDYPVMYHAEDPTYYLRRSFDKEYSISGTPFFDIRTKFDEKEDTSPTFHIIYGHNMNDESMFSNLSIYKKMEAIEKSEPIILETKNKKYKYKIFASLMVQEYTKTADYVYGKTFFTGEQDYLDYMAFIKSNAICVTDDIPAYGTDILLLSTCTSNSDRGRLIVLAGRVDE